MIGKSDTSTRQRVACYVRVSSEEQQQAGTIENQVGFLTRYCELHELLVFGFYKDDGVSGTIPFEKRPDGARLLKDAEAGKFSAAIVYRLDRLARKTRVLLDAHDRLGALSVALRSATEPFDTGTPIGQFVLTLLASLAELERATILERMSLGANRKAAEGKWLGGIVPFGYRVNADGFLEVSEEALPGLSLSEAEVVRECYRRLAEEGWSTVRIADHLNALGVPPSYTKDGRLVQKGKRKEHTSGRWLPSRVRNMVIEPIYKGIHYYGRRSARKDREVVERKVPAIVSAETWERAQAVLHSNMILSPKNAKRQYLLRGLIKCGLCGLTYCGTPGGSRERAYYKCNGKIAYRGKLDGRCPSKPVPVEEVEDAVWKDITDFVANPGQVLIQLRAQLEDGVAGRQSIESEGARLDVALQKKQREREVVIGLLRKETITEQEGEVQLAGLAREMETLRQEQARLFGQLQSQVSHETQLLEADALLHRLSDQVDVADWETKRKLVEALVAGIKVDTVGEGREKKANVSVTYAFGEVAARTGRGSSHRSERTWPGTRRCPGRGRWSRRRPRRAGGGSRGRAGRTRVARRGRGRRDLKRA